ncbi:MAG: phosphatase PAP2 family protein, partial [Actinobacteria bacterium]|nr:phosphatase PAP2 family protein [Actinomycetota bacterium]
MSERAPIVAAAVVAGAFALLAFLVVHGTLNGIDQYAVDHWMRHLSPTTGSSSPIGKGLFVPQLGSPIQTFCNVWTYPASAALSTALLLAVCVYLLRHGRRTVAYGWLALWAVGNGVEIVGKHMLRRPVLHVGTVALHAFDHSFPSGHTLRGLLLAALVATAWRATRPFVAVWVAVALPALVINAAHTPTDIAGGILVATFALLSLRA